MKFTVTIEVEVERESGKFASRDEISDELANLIDDPGSVDGLGADGDSIYNVTGWDVTVE